MERAQEDLRRLNVRAAAEMGGVAGSLANAGGAIAEVGGDISNFGHGMQTIGDKATRCLTLPIAGAATACAAAAVEIDTSLTNVRKTVDGTEEQYQQLKDAAIEFSKTNAVSASQILDIQALGAQLGYSIDELQNFGEVVSVLDIATNMSAEQAATELAQFANIMGMAHSETERYGSTIVGLGNNFATTESDISSMAMRIAGAGKQIGLSEADVLGLSTALSSMGINAEAGGTAISTIMAGIDADVSKGVEAMKFSAAEIDAMDKTTQKAVVSQAGQLQTWADAAGVSAEKFAAAWKEKPTEALSAVLSGMDEATQQGGNMTIMLEELGITSIRQTDTLKRLANNSSFLGRAVDAANTAWEENTALQAEVDNRNNSMAARFEMLKNRVTAVAEEVGTPLVNAAIEFVDAAEPLLSAVEGAADAFSDMDEADQRMIVGLAAAAAAAGPVLSVGGRLVKTVGDLTVAAGAGAQSLGAFAGECRKSGTAFTVASKAASAFDRACKMTAVGLAVGLVADLAGQLADYAAHEKLVHDATDRMTGAMGLLGDAGGEAAAGVADAGGAMGDAAATAQECLQAQAELAQSMRDTWRDVSADIATVDSYTDSIARLSGKAGLTAQEQAELAAAVQGYNEMTGDSVSIIDAQNGQLSKSTDEIMRNAQAWEQRAKAEAAQELYKESVKQMIQDNMALADAQRELATASEGFGLWIGDFPVFADEASVKYHELQGGVDDLSAAVEANKTTQGQLLDMMAEASTSGFASFDEALRAAGVSLIDFGMIGTDQLGALRDNFDGSLQSIAATCEAEGIRIPEALAGAIGEGSQGALSAASALGSDTDAALASSISSSGSLASAAMGGVASGVVSGAAGLPGQMGALGTTAGGEFQGKFSAQAPGVLTASGSLQDNALKGVGGTGEKMGKAGTDASARFAKGVGSGKPLVSAQSRGVADATKGMNANSSSAFGWGAHSVQNYADGMRSKISAVSSASDAVARAEKSKLGHTVAEEGFLHVGGKGEAAWGAHAVENYASGMVSKTALVEAAAEKVARASLIESPVSTGSAPQLVRSTPTPASAPRGAVISQQPQTEEVHYHYSIGDLTLNCPNVSGAADAEEIAKVVYRLFAGAEAGE